MKFSIEEIRKRPHSPKFFNTKLVETNLLNFYIQHDLCICVTVTHDSLHRLLLTNCFVGILQSFQLQHYFAVQSVDKNLKFTARQFMKYVNKIFIFDHLQFYLFGFAFSFKHHSLKCSHVSALKHKSMFRPDNIEFFK